MHPFSAYLAESAPAVSVAPVGPEAPAKIIFHLGQIAVTESALFHAGIVIGVVFVLSLLLKRVFAAIGHRMTDAKPLTGAAFFAVSHSTHLLLFAFTVRSLVPSPLKPGESPEPDELIFGHWSVAADRTAKMLLIVAVTVAILHLVRVPVAWFRSFSRDSDSRLDGMLVPVLETALRVLVIIGGVIQVISSMSGSTPAQILAPLAVGGLAIGLAAQDTVKNFFGAIMLIIDEPFRIGDVVNIGSHTGTVEALGLRSTRIRTPDGHLVTVPNGDLANRAIQNVTGRRNIRQVLSIGLTCDTTATQIEAALATLKDLLKDHEGLDPAFPARVHFEKMADWSQNVQIVYWYHPADYWKFMEFNERLMLDILRRFEAAGIRTAVPTQATYSLTPAPTVVPAPYTK